MENINKLLIFRLKCYIHSFHNQFRITVEKALKRDKENPTMNIFQDYLVKFTKFRGWGSFGHLRKETPPIPLP